jgi:F420-dependent methylenetetrahydromethanopterin dehydrogenase
VELIQQDIVREEVKPKEREELPEIRPIENQQSTIENKERRLRIAKAKAKAKLKILNLLKL